MFICCAEYDSDTLAVNRLLKSNDFQQPFFSGSCFSVNAEKIIIPVFLPPSLLWPEPRTIR